MLAADLVHRQVSAIATIGSTQAISAAKAATATTPIVFVTGGDPVRIGLVASPNRPGGNLTGVTVLSVEILPKRLELLHELVPTVAVIAVLVNPTNPQQTDAEMREVQAAARTLGLQLHILNAGTDTDIDAAFAAVMQVRAGALLIGNDAFFNSRSEELAARTLREGVPTIFNLREFTAAGGLMSYGASLTDAYRQAGVYTGRILKGEMPADLPVVQSSKVELFINLKTAKALGIMCPSDTWPRRRSDRMRRREFIALIGGAAASWPLAARAQQPGLMRRIGVLLWWSSSNREGQAGLAAFKKVLQQAGWTDGVNIHFDIRWSEENAEHIAETRPNWLRSRPMLSSPMRRQACRRFNSHPRRANRLRDGLRSGGSRHRRSIARPGGNSRAL